MPDLHAFLWPRSVAVIGASNDPHILRGALMKVLAKHAYDGDIYPVSRSEDRVCGLRAYPAIGDVPGPVDLAVIVIPAKFVADCLEDCGKAGVKAATIISSGFAEESGSGEAEELRLREIAERYDMAVVGPNAEGFANTLNNLSPTFSPAMDMSELPLMPRGRSNGHIAVLAQSGGVGFAFYDRGRPKALSFNYIVSMGNEACLEITDFLDHMLDEGRTDVFILFMENVKDADKFRAAAAKALAQGKPIIVVKIGRSDAGVRAAMSHTAAMAGSYSGYRAIFDQYGLIEVEELGEAVEIAAGFSNNLHRLPRGKRLGITTGSGGAGGWMADTASLNGLTVPPLDAETRARIDEHLPDYGTSQNPVDATAQAIRKLGNAKLAEWVAASDEVDAVIAVTSAKVPTGYTSDQDAMRRLNDDATKPILFCSYTDPHPDAVRAVADTGFIISTDMRNSAKTINAMADYRARREQFLASADEALAATPLNDVSEALKEIGSVLCEYQAADILGAYGIDIPTSHLVQDQAEARAAANSLGGPAAMKVQSPDIPHKSDSGLVALNIEGEEQAATTFEELLQRAKQHASGADIHGVLIQSMAPAGLEMIVGIHRDETFGLMISVGLGGIFVEVLADTVSAPVPLAQDDAERLVDGLKGRALLDGLRGQDPTDIEALLTLLVDLSHFAARHETLIDEVDLNPVLLHPAGQGLTIVDALIVKRRDKAG